MRPRIVEQCLIDGCPNNAIEYRAICHAHHKRKVRGRPVGGPLVERGMPALARLLKAVIAYGTADAADDIAWRRALDNLRYAARVWVHASPTQRKYGALTKAEVRAFRKWLRVKKEMSPNTDTVEHDEGCQTHRETAPVCRGL